MEKQFVAYEYKEVKVSKARYNLFKDLVGSFGWIITDTETGILSNTLYLKRDYDVKNREGVIAEEKEFFKDFFRIEKINATKNDKATTVATTLGVIGTAFMAGAVFSYLASLIWVMVALAVPAFLLWGLAPLTYKKMMNKKNSLVKEETEELTSNLYVHAHQAFTLINA